MSVVLWTRDHWKHTDLNKNNVIADLVPDTILSDLLNKGGKKCYHVANLSTTQEISMFAHNPLFNPVWSCVCIGFIVLCGHFSQDSGYQHSYRRGGGRHNSGKNTSSNSNSKRSMPQELWQ